MSTAYAPRTTGTVHPSALLRLPHGEDRAAEIAKFHADLARARRELEHREGTASS